MPKFSHWPDGTSYPIYINPTFDELKELAATRPDTVRIMVYDEDLAIASGYGNTHDSVQKGYCKYVGHRDRGIDYILYCEGRRQWFFNMMGHTARLGDDERWPWEKAVRELPHEETFRDLIKLLTEPEPANDEWQEW